MGKKLFNFVCLLAILVLAAPSPALSSVSVNAPEKSVTGMFKSEKFDAHYRVPSEGGVIQALEKAGVITKDGPVIQSQVQEFYNEFNARNPDTVDPRKLEALLARERGDEGPSKSAYFIEPTVMSLAVPVEFPPVEETVEFKYFDVDLDDCATASQGFVGPAHNEIASPGLRDNNTLWYEDSTPELYNEIFFGQGPDAGVVVNHPNLGEVDLRGLTMVNYYLEQSNGKFRPYGEVYPEWLEADHVEAYYGQDSCDGSSHNVYAGDLVKEVIAKIKSADPNFDWQAYDGDHDGVIDNFTIIHAGMGQEAGGGAQGDFAIWSHASMIGGMNGYLVCEAGAAGCPDRDIRVQHYSMDPENIDLGVIAEEFGHAAFGLPDIYSGDDYQNPVSNWAIMESGSWNGILGGTQPAPFPLFFRYLLGWADVVETDYNGDALDVVVGQLSQSPFGTADGIKINLPSVNVPVANPLDTGNALWSDVGNTVLNEAVLPLDLSSATAPVTLSMKSYWSIEEDWDYGYVMVSADGGETWDILTDTTSVCRTTNPHENNIGCGITGESQGDLIYNLSGYAGQSVMVKLLYATDTAEQWSGWWVDDISVTDASTTLYSTDFEGGLGEWMTDDWMLTPVTKVLPSYYLVEWRNNSGFDQGLKYAYQTVYSDEDEWKVDRAPYTVPGMLVWTRNASYDFDYSLSDKLFDSPSFGIKSALTLVDSHPFPYTWNAFKYPSGAHARVSGRVTPGDAAFTLGPTTSFKIRAGYNPITGALFSRPKSAQKFGPEPGVQVFHDSVGYYPGFYGIFNSTEQSYSLYAWDVDGSSVVPALGDYSVRVTDLKKRPLYALYNIPASFGVLGSGNPGDDDVQYGIHIAPVKQAEDGSWAEIQVWNSTDGMLKAAMKASPASQRVTGAITYKVTITNPMDFDTTYTVSAGVPAGTTYRSGPGYNKSAQTVRRSGKIKAGQTITVTILQVTVKANQSGGTISATAIVQDEATNETVVTVDTPVLSGRR